MTLNPVSRRRERCSEARALLSEYVDGELDQRSSVEHHLRWCTSCRRMARNLSRTVGGLAALGQSDRDGDVEPGRS
jgi:predicted anti-sigma-YlaC factor YlaD